MGKYLKAPFSAKLFIAAVLVLSVTSVLFAADEPLKRFLYQWTDDGGNTHITDGLEKVPKKFRSRAQAMEQKVPDEGKQEGDGNAPAQYAPGDDAEFRQQTEERQKAEWQARMADARTRKAEAESRLRTSEKSLKVLEDQFGYGAYGYTAEMQAEIDRLNKEIAQARTDVEDARNMIENVIPDEARKAGIPPGWLRE